MTRTMRSESAPLKLGCVIHCKVCGEEHQTKGARGASVDAVKQMLYVYCAKPSHGLYYVGSIGGASNRGPIVTTKGEG